MSFNLPLRSIKMYKIPSKLEIDGVEIGNSYPTYFIADIAANHDGDIERAKRLIYLAAESGANAAKFQHFRAETIVSDEGFKSIDFLRSHQSSWKKSVFNTYKDASVSKDWSPILAETCKKANISFLTSPYEFDLVDHINPFVQAFKIGSGDITWTSIIKYIAEKQKPYILATGASTMDEVIRAVDSGLSVNKKLILMQCNTNYTGDLENLKYVQLNVLKTYRSMYPDMILGLSDHTPGHATVLGAIALGARVIEKHFTDDISRIGPDHGFSMDPESWMQMVKNSRQLEAALGGGVKRVEENERETVLLQRRSLRITRELKAGHLLETDDLIPLRPCPPEALEPCKLNEVLGKVLLCDKKIGDYLSPKDFS